MKYYFALLVSLLVLSSKAQTLSDALLYADDNIIGTARFSAMSGAFGALGGDFSSIHVNPAGSAVFSNNQAAITLSSLNTKNQSNYFGSKINSNQNSFDINQVGGILVFNNYEEKSKWKKIALSVDYENMRNFDNSIISMGTNPNQSVADYFLSYANPGLYGSYIPLTALTSNYYEDLDIRGQQAYLGYQGYVINPDPSNPNNNTYVANVSPGSFYQENYMDTSGYNGKVAFNISAQYTDKFYFGFNFNTHFTDIERTSLFYEYNENNQTDGLRELNFENYTHTYGNGYSFQLGAIAKLNSQLRAGLAYESPTWYRLNDEKKQLLSTSGFNYGNPPVSSLTSILVDSDFLIIYPTYKLQTPSKWTGSLAYIFGKNGLISIDYSLKDYSNIQFKPNDSYFRPLNDAANQFLKTSGELRIGGEYRYKLWSFRGGYRYEQSPYENKRIMGDLTGFSTGFGYNFGNTKLDLSYSYAQRKSQEAVFSQGFTAPQNLKTQFNNISATLLFEL
ncbi:MAG: outer membrane protein transport protein [Bacteroidetes bacterium]|nr:outer membrane protein transport protein [Bacteroidota bacterium]